MKKVGIVCNMSWNRCFNLKQYYHSIKNLYGEVQLVNTCEDLEGLDILFCGDDHHYAHTAIITQPGFVEKCNTDKIKVVIFTAEKIFDAFFDTNITKFKFVKRFNNLLLHTMDADDCELLGTRLHRPLFSKDYKDYITVDIDNKIDEIVFIGQANPKLFGGCYKERDIELKALQKLLPITIIPNTIELWKDYMETLAKYRFVLYPAANGNFLGFRFYETLLAKAIPVCRVWKNTLKYYDIEAKFDDCIFYEDVAELPEKIKNCTLKHSHSELWAEDHLGKVLKADGVL